MAKSKTGYMAAFASVVLCHLFLACAHVDTADIDVDYGKLQLSGDTVGTIPIEIRFESSQNEIQRIAGSFGGNVQDHLGGRGHIGATLRGAVEGRSIRFTFRGSAGMATTVEIDGKAEGTVSDSQWSGTYRIHHEEGSSSGEWVIRFNP